MARYRFCLFSRWGSLFFADVFECADDTDAKDIITQRLAAHPEAHAFELWEDNRLVLAGLTTQHRSK